MDSDGSGQGASDVGHPWAGTLRGLVRASHPEPAAAVTVFASLLAWSAGRGWPLAGQLSVGWSNDYIDRDRDARVGRLDKPVVTAQVAPRTVRAAAVLAAAAAVPLSLLSGPVAGLLHIAAVASAWSYNLRLKATPLSVLPYALSFALLPAFITAGLPGAPVIGWLVGAGGLLGAGAHFANVLPDLADDLRTGVRGLPHRIGAGWSRLSAATLLLAASAVLALVPRDTSRRVRAGCRRRHRWPAGGPRPLLARLPLRHDRRRHRRRAAGAVRTRPALTRPTAQAAQPPGAPTPSRRGAPDH